MGVGDQEGKSDPAQVPTGCLDILTGLNGPPPLFSYYPQLRRWDLLP